MKSHLSLLLAALGSFSVRPAVQDASPAQPDGVPSVPDVLAEWRAEHGRAWQTEVDHRTGHVDFLFGGTAHGELSPVTDEEWLAAGRAFVEESIDLHGIEVDTLVDERVLYLPLGMVGSSDKWTARYQQRVNQVPVVDGTVNVLFDAFGGLLSIQSNAEPWVSGLDTVPSIGAGQAAASAGQHFTERFGVQARPGSLPAPVILRASDGEAIVAQLAWQLDLAATLPDGTPEAWRYWVSAEDGSVLRADTHKHNLDVEGTVQSLVTPGTSPDTPGNAEVLEPMPYIRVTSSAGTVNADENGYFVFPGVNSPLSVTVQYTGTFANVDHATGSNYSLTVQVPANSPSSVVTMNPSPTEVITAQANAYLNVTLLRDWIRGINPSDSTADFQAQANANLSNTCNAFFNGNSTNYYQSGGGCVNTAYSTVVAHEMGHWLNVLYGTGNGSDGIGEGNADVFATYMFDDPIVGKDFSGSGNHIRDGNNNNQFCGDCCGGCYGGVHADGTVWMGAAWKVRTNLNTTNGNALGDAIANALFLGWMNGYDQTQIKSVIETQWLTLDDDDGDITNGTPNYFDIDQGFRQQGFPGYDIPFVNISGVTELADTENEVGPYQVDATITAGVNPPLASASIQYRVNGGAFQSAGMANISGDLFRGFIPGQAAPAEVEYYVLGTDSGGNSESYPEDAPNTTLPFDVGIKTILFEFDFEAGTDEGWGVGHPGDDATTGEWERVDPVATAAQPGDDHTDAPGVLCWVTGQQPSGGSLGTNDVDGGRTTLKSPIFSATGFANPKISYWRWYSNDAGAAPNTDFFEVDLSSDGGTNWTSVEIVGPTGVESNGGWYRYQFAIADILTPTTTMQLRFVASDEGDGSIVEAAIDDVVAWDLDSGFTDCNTNGVDDSDDITNGTSLDCNANGIPDECELDCDGDGVPDDCETDCNSNGTPDDCESFSDCDSNGVPDECQADCDSDGTPDACEADCNANGTPDDCESFSDCDSNGVPDECQADCDSDGTPDACEADCNANGTPDDCESFSDCDSNGVPDECQADCDSDGTPDACEADCNANGTPDDCESFSDCDSNGVPDECQPDCDSDGTPDACETDCNSNGTPDDCESFSDCNSNGVPDDCEADCDSDGTPDDCETDCNANGTPDDCESFSDCDSNGVPDECQPDCDSDGTPDACETDCNANGTPDDCETFSDCNSNGVPDECEADCDSDGTPDDCETDCNSNGTPDDCESFSDCNSNGVPDECEADCDSDGTPDDCETDCNSNGTPDDCESFSDCDSNGVPDECQADCDSDGTPDACETDCNANGTPDDCETFDDCNSNGIPDECDPDGDGDGTPDDCELGTNYCGPAVPNSAGTSAVIGAEGSTVVADNDLTLIASEMPIFKFGYFLVSGTQAFVPNPGGSQGNLCLGGTIGRYKNDVLTSDVEGAFSLAIDLNSLPAPLLVPVLPGETWNWQAWFRDNNPNQTSNFTDAISITFQ